MRDKNTREFFFSDVDSNGELLPTRYRVGKDDPAKQGIQKGLRKKNNRKDKGDKKGKKRGNIFDKHRMLDDGSGADGMSTLLDDHHRRTTQTTGTVKNLVIPIKWSDHTGRTLPSKEDIDVLMNHNGPERRCPTGSVRDVFLENSYGKFELESTVVDWVLMPNSEAFYADGESG
jgi:hypothetical protein